MGQWGQNIPGAVGVKAAMQLLRPQCKAITSAGAPKDPQGPRSRGRNTLKPQRDNGNPPLGAQHRSEAEQGEKQPHISPHSLGFKL